MYSVDAMAEKRMAEPINWLDPRASRRVKYAEHSENKIGLTFTVEKTRAGVQLSY